MKFTNLQPKVDATKPVKSDKILDFKYIDGRMNHKKDFESLKQRSIWNLYRDGITQSMLRKFLSCPEMMRLAYIECLEPLKESTHAIEFGDMFHDCLDKVYTEATVVKDLPAFVQTIPSFVRKLAQNYWDKKYVELVDTENGLSGLNRVNELNAVILPRYFDYYKDDWNEMQLVSREEIFDVVIVIKGTKIRIRGKFDMIVRWKGKLWLFETKTKGKINETAIENSLHTDLQVNSYLWAINEVYGECPAGVIYNVIRSPGQKVNQNEKLADFAARVGKLIDKDPGYFFLRPKGEIILSDITRWEQEFKVILNALMEWYEGGANYKNPTSCTTTYGACDYLQICGPNNRGFYKPRVEMFPELKLIQKV